MSHVTTIGSFLMCTVQLKNKSLKVIHLCNCSVLCQVGFLGNGVRKDFSMQSLAILSFLFLKAVNCFGTTRDHVHKGATLQTMYGLDWLSCLVACSHNGRCFSYNYKGTTEREEGNSICQLFDSLDFDECNSEETSNFLVYAPGFIFHQIQANVKVRKIEIAKRFMVITPRTRKQRAQLF